MNVKNISANIAYIAPEDTILKVDCSVGATAVYFSEPSVNYRGVFTVKKTDSGANAVTIYPYSGETIDGSASVTLTSENDYKTFSPVTGGWAVIDAYSGLTVTTTGTQTLTNKTLTAPKLNENVAVTATATELNKLSGISTNSNSSMVQIATALITYEDSGAALFTVPANTFIYSFNIVSEEGFSGGSSPTYSLGVSGSPTSIINATTLPTSDITYSGVVAATVNGAGLYFPKPTEIIGTFGGTATQGSGILRVAYHSFTPQATPPDD